MTALVLPRPTAPAAGGLRLTGLDAVRALALLLVLAFHVEPSVVPGGFVGVDVFFVVSGYLITVLLLREHGASGRIDLRGFFVRRARRLIPVAAVVVLVCSTLALLLGGDVLVGLPAALLGAATFSSNWVQLLVSNDYFARSGTGLFDNFWSLAIEEQFYLLWPVVLILLGGRVLSRSLRQRLVLVVVLSALAPLVLTAAGQSSWAYLSTFGHSFGLLLGAVTALLLGPDASTAASGRGARIGWSGLAGLAATGLVALALSPFAALPQARSLASITAGLLTLVMVLGLIRGVPAIAPRLDGSLVGWVGRRSYGIYLWHLPLLVLAQAALPGSGEQKVLVRLFAVGLAVALSALCFRFVEAPVRVRGWRAVLRRPAGGSAIAATAVGLALVSTLVTAGAPSETSIGRLLGEAEAGSESASSVAGVDGAGEETVAIGDSVMLASSAGLSEKFPGITLDAAVDRQLTVAAETISEHVAEDPGLETIVLGLGINGVGGADDLRDAVEAAGGRDVVLVNVWGPVAWAESVNSDIAEVADEFDNVAVADWRSRARAHPELLAKDGIHPGDAGGRLYAASIEDALESLA